MYANLSVTYRERNGESKTVAAWQVEKESGTPDLVIHLDAADSEDNYAVEAGTVKISAIDLLSVEADF